MLHFILNLFKSSRGLSIVNGTTKIRYMTLARLHTNSKKCFDLFQKNTSFSRFSRTYQISAQYPSSPPMALRANIILRIFCASRLIFSKQHQLPISREKTPIDTRQPSLPRLSIQAVILRVFRQLSLIAANA